MYEIQQSASLAFSKFGTAHKTMADEGMKFIINVGPVRKWVGQSVHSGQQWLALTTSQGKLAMSQTKTLPLT